MPKAHVTSNLEEISIQKPGSVPERGDASDRRGGGVKGLREQIVPSMTAGKKTILHIIPSLRQGGAEKILSTVVSQMTDAYAHRIVTLLDDAPFFDHGTADLLTVGMDRSRLDIGAIGRLVRTTGQLRPALIHAWMYHANFLSMFLLARAAPILWSIHNTDLSKTHTRLRTRCVNWAGAGLSYVVPSRIVYCSKSAKNAHEAIGYSPTKSRVIENGVTVSDFFPDGALRRAMRRELGLADTDFAVCSLARFDPQKDHATLFDTIVRSRAIVPQLRILLVGTGCEPQNQLLTDALRRSGLMECALLLGERRDINGILNASDLLVVSSAFGEALPLAILEAAAVGLPVVSTAIGDIESLNLADAIVPAQEPAQLANAITAFATKPHSAAASAAKRRLVERGFSTERMLSSYDQTYRELLASTTAPIPSYG